MKKKSLEKYYYSHSIPECLAHFGICRKTLYTKLNKFKIKKKKDLDKHSKWLMSANIPEDLEVDNGNSYCRKWKEVIGKPLEWWAKYKVQN